MFKDDELDRLGRERDRLFERVKAVREERKRLGGDCTALHAQVDEAFRAQQKVYEAQQYAWDKHRAFMRDCSQKIEFYRGESDRWHSRMTEAFQESQRAWDRGDKTAAASWSATAKDHQSMMRGAKAQIAHWVSQSKDAKYRHAASAGHDLEAAKRATARAKDEFSTAAARLKAAKAEVDRLEKEFDAARGAFGRRLEFLKVEIPRDRERRIAVETTNEAFRSARAKELFFSQVGRDHQSGSKDSDIQVKVKAGWNRDHEMACTDVLIFVKGEHGHHHIVIGENGEVFIDQWRP